MEVRCPLRSTSTKRNFRRILGVEEEFIHHDDRLLQDADGLLQLGGLLQQGGLLGAVDVCCTGHQVGKGTGAQVATEVTSFDKEVGTMFAAVTVIGPVAKVRLQTSTRATDGVLFPSILTVTAETREGLRVADVKTVTAVLTVPVVKIVTAARKVTAVFTVPAVRIVTAARTVTAVSTVTAMRTVSAMRSMTAMMSMAAAVRTVTSVMTVTAVRTLIAVRSMTAVMSMAAVMRIVTSLRTMIAVRSMAAVRTLTAVRSIVAVRTVTAVRIETTVRTLTVKSAVAERLTTEIGAVPGTTVKPGIEARILIQEIAKGLRVECLSGDTESRQTPEVPMSGTQGAEIAKGL